VSTKCVLLLRYKLKPGVSQQFRKLLKDVLEECIKEPAFLTYTLHTYPVIVSCLSGISNGKPCQKFSVLFRAAMRL
jgi:hypothetical protein